MQTVNSWFDHIKVQIANGPGLAAHDKPVVPWKYQTTAEPVSLRIFNYINTICVKKWF